MSINQETLYEILEQVKPSLIEGLKNELKAGITFEAKNAMAEQVQLHVKDWMAAEVLPEITKNLIESKDSLIALGPKIGEKAAEDIARVFSATLKEKLESSWERREVFKALFG